MISVIVPVYNVKDYIKTCIESIQVQTYSDFELILVDDGSTDGSGEICDAYGKTDQRLRVVHQENAGLSAARNAGIEKAKGEFLTFIDSDDSIHRKMLEQLTANQENTNADISVCGFQLVYEGKMENRKEKNWKICGDVIIYTGVEAVERIVNNQEKNMIVAWGKLYARNLFKEVRYPNGKCHEDEYTTYRLFYQADKVVFTAAPFYYYLQRGASIMGTGYSLKRLDKLEALKECMMYFRGKNEMKLCEHAEYRYLFNIQIAYYRVFYEMKENEKVLRALSQEYDRGYRNCSVKKSKVISCGKKALLQFFFRAKGFYCFLVRIYAGINHNLEQ